jgi:RHS repeat-associated protein
MGFYVTEEHLEDVPRAEARGNENPHRGPKRRVESGLRFYNPELGRWPSRDPIEEEGGVNLYVFVLNNSLSYFDDYGQRTRPVPPEDVPPPLPPNIPPPSQFSCQPNRSVPFTLPCDIECEPGIIGNSHFRAGTEWPDKNGRRWFTGVICNYVLTRYCTDSRSGYVETQLLQQIRLTRALDRLGDYNPFPPVW